MDANSYLKKKEKVRKLDVMLDLMREQMKQLESTMEAVRKAADEDMGDDLNSLNYLDRDAVRRAK